MKAGLILLLCVCSIVHAETLPPVEDDALNLIGAASTVKSAAPNVLYEVMGQLQQLQAEVQQLTGKVEEQANLIAQMKKSQVTLYSDIDARIQGLEKKADSVKPPLASPVVDSKVASASEVAPSVQKADAVQASAAPVSDEKQQYQQAYEALRNGHTTQAIAEFSALLSKKPKGEYANNAQYWLGEAYRVNQDIDSARKAFTNVLENYRGSSKAPDALLKLGYIEVEQKNTLKAREYLTRVTVDFPNSTAAHLAAKKLLTLEDVK
jgi:tol-pal system protein YbgF